MRAHAESQPPIRTYLWVWAVLFVFSALSYLVDFAEVRPQALKSFLITAFALIKAALILSYFMHLRFERLNLVLTILLPPLLIVALAAIVMGEGAYVAELRRLVLQWTGS